MANRFSIYDGKANSFSLTQLGILIGIGFMGAVAPITISLVWIGIFLFTLYGFYKGRMDWIWYSIAASPIMEVLARMSEAPMIPDEVGKYFVLMSIMLLSMNKLSNKYAGPAHRVGVFILAAIIPSLIVSIYAFDYEQWVFNILGLLELAILSILIATDRWGIERFCKTLQFGAAPIIFFAVYLSINTPKFTDIDFELGANFQTSGGFGSNQVSTILGLGMVLLVILLTLKRPFVKQRWINIALIGYLLFRGLLTFSRGGVVVAVLAIGIIMLPTMLSNAKAFFRYFIILIGLVIMGGLVFLQVNELTGNQLLLRYQGETKGTQMGTQEKTLGKITSGRSRIVEADYHVFLDHMLFGAGPGGAKQLRSDYLKSGGHVGGAAAHTEYSRLLSEHGLGGLLTCIILSVFPFIWVRKQRMKAWKGVSSALFLVAILTSMHAAMRTNTTTVCFVIAAVPIVVAKQTKKKLDTVNGKGG